MNPIFEQAILTKQGYKYYLGTYISNREKRNELIAEKKLMKKSAWHNMKRKFLAGGNIKESTMKRIIKNVLNQE